MAYKCSNTIFEGQLKKQGGRLRTWKTRWFVLTEDKRMRYFSCPEKKKLIAEFSLKGHELYVIPNDALDTSQNDRFLFEIRSGDGTRLTESHDSFLLWATSEQERESWVFVLKKAMYRERGGAIFGHNLAETMAVDGRYEYFVPRIVQELVEFIHKEGTEQEGIFRLSGRKKQINEMIDHYDRGIRVDLNHEDMDVHAATSVLKEYLRRLPEPLIPFDRFEEMSTYGSKLSLDLPDMTEVYDLVCRGLNSLPVWNYNLLKYLINFLVHIASNSHINKMSPANLAAIYAPNILRIENENAELMATVNMVVVETTLGFIKHFDTLFTREYSLGNIKSPSPQGSPVPVYQRTVRPSGDSHSSAELIEESRESLMPFEETELPSNYLSGMSNDLKQILTKSAQEETEEKLKRMLNKERILRREAEEKLAVSKTRREELTARIRALEIENASLRKKLERVVTKTGTLA